MRRNLLAASLIGLLLTPVAFASVGGATAQDNHPFESEPGQPDAQIMRVVTLVIKEVGPENTLKLLNPEDESEVVIQLSDDVPLRAKSKKLFDGRKRLAFGDLARGQKIRLAFRADDGQILRITVLKIAATA